MHYSRPGHQEDFPEPKPSHPPEPTNPIERKIENLLAQARSAGVPDADIEAGIDIAHAAVEALIKDRA